MAREIKFRGKRLDTGKWVFGTYLKHQKVMPCPMGHTESEADYEHLIIYDGFADWNLPRMVEATQVDPATVGQFTGLKDKNGKEIYEGDIITELSGRKYKVEYLYDTFGAYDKEGNGMRLSYYCPQCEVIGNKWEG